MRRCTAEVILEAQLKGSGYIAHPAVTDNCMQLGPGTAALDSSNAKHTTRIVAGLSAYHVRCILSHQLSSSSLTKTDAVMITAHGAHLIFRHLAERESVRWPEDACYKIHDRHDIREVVA